jgi:hypothetical protein
MQSEIPVPKGGRAPAPRRWRPLRALARLAAGVVLVVAVLAAGLAILAAMSPRAVMLPVWMLAEAEARLTRALADRGGAGLAVSLGAIGADVEGGVPRLTLRDVRLQGPDGAARLRLPLIEARFERAALARGMLRLADVAVQGARLRLTRDPGGTLDIAFGDGTAALTVPDVTAALLRLFAAPELSGPVRLAVTGAGITFVDRRAGRVWEVTDGTALVTRAEGGALALDIALTQGAATARLSALLAPDRTIMVDAGVEGVPAGDLAVQSPALGWLAPLDAALSGALAARFDAAGTLTRLDGRLSVGAGEIRPAPAAAPIAVEGATLAFVYDPAEARVRLPEVALHSPTLRLAAAGEIAIDGTGTAREAFRGVFTLRSVTLDPAGTFAAPLVFDGGRLEGELRLAPFAFDLRDLTLTDAGRRLSAAGRVAADAAGWAVTVDAGIDRIPADRLLMLWPLGLLPRTRAWLEANVREGLLTDVRAALRARPGEGPPALSLDYDYRNATVRLLPALPPLIGVEGHATLSENTYVLHARTGRIDPPEGGPIDIAGSVFRVPDTTRIPAMAEVRIAARGRVTAVLSLLDQPPFRFAAAAGIAPSVAAGDAQVTADLTLPLVQGLTPADVTFAATGTLTDVVSTTLIRGRRLAAEALRLTADNRAVAIAGALTLDGVRVDAVWRQPLGRGAGPAQVTGTVALSPAFARAFLPGLPAGAVTGAGKAAFTLDLPRGAVPVLRLRSDLAGLRLALPALGWEKPAERTGRFEAVLRLGPAPVVERLVIEAPGLSAEGAGKLAAGGVLDRLDFTRVQAGAWLDAAVALDGTGIVTLSGGRIDLARMPGGLGGAGAGGGSGAPLVLEGMTVRLTDRIALTDVTGRIEARPGRPGRFAARLNGSAAVALQVEGGALRLTADDAGAALTAAGLFERARGGTLDLVLRPERGGYAGRIEMEGLRVVGMPVLAEILNAASIVGLVDQLSAGGLPFTRASAGLRIDGTTLTVRDGVAEGPSFGVTLAGRYDMAADRLAMDGVLSPLYIINGIGQVLTRPGEGMFGFTYRLSGPAARPQVTVNPLSVLAPGFLRNAFRADSGGSPPAADTQRGPGDR